MQTSEAAAEVPEYLELEPWRVGPWSSKDVAYHFVDEQSLYEFDPNWGLTVDPPYQYNGIPSQEFLPGFQGRF